MVKARFEHARKHLEFSVEFYRLQWQAGQYFLHGHLASASSWQERCIQNILKAMGVMKVVGDQCRYGLTSRDRDGDGPTRKSTGPMTNSVCIAHGLSEKVYKQKGGGTRYTNT